MKINKIKIIRGFSLIELLVVIAIIGIIAAFAYPSYQSHIRKTNRSDATTGLTTLATLQERYFSVNGSYATNVANLGLEQSTHGYYDFKSVLGEVTNVANCSSESGDSSKVNQYTLMAMPVAGEAQAQDTECECLYLTSGGHKGSTGSDPSRCW